MPDWLNSLLDWFKPKPGPGPRPNVQTFEYAHGLKLDFASAGPEVRPLVLMIHGGSWQHGDRTNMHVYAPELLKAGYHVASIDYRLAPATKWPGQRDDATKALGFLTGSNERFDVDRSRIAIVGKSSGGHIGAMLALTTSAAVKCLCLTSAALDLTGTETRKQTEALDAEFGENRTKQQLSDASPVNHVRSGAPPMLLIHGQSDTYVPPSQSVTMQRQLDLVDVPNELHLLPGETHQFSQVAQKKEREWIVAWLRKHL